MREKILGFPSKEDYLDLEDPIPRFILTMKHHRINRYLESFKIASQLVSNREFLEFIDDGGYENPLLWLSDGWSWLNENSVHQPIVLGEKRQLMVRVHTLRTNTTR